MVCPIRGARRRAVEWRRSDATRFFAPKTATASRLGALSPKFWQTVVEKLGLPAAGRARRFTVAKGPKAGPNWPKFSPPKPALEWIETFGDSDACFEPVLSFSEVRGFAAGVAARKSFLPLPTTDGRTLHVPKMPGTLAEVRYRRGGGE